MLKSFKNNKIISMRKGNISIGEKVDVSSLSSADTSRLSADTTLFKKEVRPKLKREKRKVINDKDISPSLYEKLKLKCLSLGFELKQKDIIEVLYPLNISNITMARIINELVPDAKATQGSVASMIRFLKQFKSSKQLAKELDKMLDDML
jgi:hypothetical protein